MNAVVATSKGMRAVKLCTNKKILQFLTGDAGECRITCICIMAVKRWLLLLYMYA